MTELKKFTPAVVAFFGEKGISLDECLITMESDMGKDGVYKNVYALLTKDKIAVAEGFISYEGKPKSHNRIEYFNCTDYAEFNISEFEKFEVELFISGGRAVCHKEGKTAEIMRFSSTCKHDVNVLCDAANQLKKDGKVDEERLKGETEESHFCPKCHRRYPDINRKICPKCMEKAKLVRRLAKMFLKYKYYILLIFALFAIIAGFGIVSPYVSNNLFYNEVLDEKGSMYGRIWQIVFMIIGVRLVSMLISLLNGIVNAKVAAEVVYDLKKTIFDTIGRLSLRFFTSRQTGGLMTQINSDASVIYWFFCDGFPYLVTNILQLTAVLIVMLTMDPLLTLYTFVTVPIFIIAFKITFSMFSKLHARSYSKRRSFNSLISDVLNGMRVVKSFSREETEIKRFQNRSEAQAEAQTVVGVTANKVFRMLGFLMRIGVYVVWAVGGWQVMKQTGTLNYGRLMTFIAYVGMIYDPLDFFADVSNWWSECLNALQRLFEISDSQPEVRETDNPVVLTDIKGEVEFRDVTFSYEENRIVIDHISFTVPSGSTLGIVGQTGAGKSTLANLLTRLYDPVSGEVFIDGVNLKDLSFETLRSAVAIVSQETYLFRGTIMENIRYARPDATNEEVIAAAKIASAHQFIIKYPDAYETMIGFGYKDLSGGERQRLSIARAVLKNPSILVLDEATAAMDTQTERQIQNALDSLTRNRTTIIIAHRLSTLRDADKLIVLENGKMPEEGTALELLKKKGKYYELYKMQAEALKTIGIEE
ncbi:MAG: ABC transporter ATP-binding protein [Clostridiales bacterium]|nr:ABC transporter ATP-binding protein [Clostridiales bacterium]